MFLEHCISNGISLLITMCGGAKSYNVANVQARTVFAKYLNEEKMT